MIVGFRCARWCDELIVGFRCARWYNEMIVGFRCAQPNLQTLPPVNGDEVIYRKYSPNRLERGKLEISLVKRQKIIVIMATSIRYEAIQDGHLWASILVI
jgi:hypothetical protein